MIKENGSQYEKQSGEKPTKKCSENSMLMDMCYPASIVSSFPVRSNQSKRNLEIRRTPIKM